MKFLEGVPASQAPPMVPSLARWIKDTRAFCMNREID